MNKKLLGELVSAALEGKSEGSESELPFEIGDKFLIRTVTYFATGEVSKIVGKFIQLSDAAWIASTGNFQAAIMEGTLDEVEPVDKMWINTDSIVDAFPWKHKLPRDRK